MTLFLLFTHSNQLMVMTESYPCIEAREMPLNIGVATIRQCRQHSVKQDFLWCDICLKLINHPTRHEPITKGSHLRKVVSEQNIVKLLLPPPLVFLWLSPLAFVNLFHLLVAIFLFQNDNCYFTYDTRRSTLQDRHYQGWQLWVDKRDHQRATSLTET